MLITCFFVRQNRFGACYKTGRGVNNDYGEAVKWYRKAAENGYEAAQRELAEFDFTFFWPVNRQDFEEAVKWRRKAAEQDQNDAQVSLGKCLYRGIGVKQDFEEAAVWLRKAAESHRPEAQTLLGNMYRNGEGVPKDDEQAVYWYRRAADWGDSEAQYRLALCLLDGIGVPKNTAEAIRLLRVTAEKRYPGAKDKLKELADKGDTQAQKAFKEVEAEHKNDGISFGRL